MDKNEIEQIIVLTGERFYECIEQQYGKFVGKILRYHDIDSYLVLSRTNEHDLIDVFEKPDDENTTDELINLRKEICNKCPGSVSLKIGTKNKLLLLLKSTQYILKQRRLQISSQARSKRLDNHRSTSSSTNSSDSEANSRRYHASIEDSLAELLLKLKKNIHGTVYTNVSTNDFKVIIENITDSNEPVSTLQCICGDRIKLYLKKDRFQLSNFMKHLNIIKKIKSPFLINNNQGLNDREASDQVELDNQLLTNEKNVSITQNNSNKYVHAAADDSDKSTPVAIQRAYSQSQRSRVEVDNDEYIDSSTKTIKDRHDGQRPIRTSPEEGETHSSISFVHSSKSKKQTMNYSQRQTTNPPLPSTYQYSKSLIENSFKSSNSSQSKKRKVDENEKSADYHSSTKNKRKVPEQNISYVTTDTSDILSELLNTIECNRHRSPNNYRYSDSVLRFATCLFLLAGAYAYEYLRINFKFLLPSIRTITNYYKQNPYSEGLFRFNETKTYLDSIQCQHVFLSEDCSAIIPRVEYDSTLNSFNGFVTPIVDGKPKENAFNCQSFEEFEHLLETVPRASLANVHLVQPISGSNVYVTPAATILSAYGTNNKITSTDILKRWLMIYQELHSRNIRVIGFATDGDPKYLRAMRLACNFFVKTQTLNIYNEKVFFTVKIPSSWSSWYFLNSSQLFLFMQDGIHLCTKIRNRLLSKNAKLKMGKQNVSINHLYELIKTSNKIDHNLCSSDLNVRDKQNFASCERISSDKVLNLLLLNDRYKATYVYLLILNLLIMAYTRSEICLLTRIYYAWIVVFFVRLWRIWLNKTKRFRRSSNSNGSRNEQNHFITPNALLSIELNAHCLIYVCLLIEQKLVPESAANSINLFSSQPCESVFRDARALSGIYSTRINFTMKQFLQRINKLNALTELRQFESTNKQEKIIFPTHHKIKRITIEKELNNVDKDAGLSSDNVETTILQAYEEAQRLVVFVGMDQQLIKYHVFDMEESSQMTQKLLNLNSLTESEILVLDNRDTEDSDEEGYQGEDDGAEDDRSEDGDEEQDNETEDDDEDVFGGNGSDLNDHPEDGDVEDCIAEDAIEGLNEDVHYYYSSEDDAQPTAGFENVQTTSYSGIYQRNCNVENLLTEDVYDIRCILQRVFATKRWFLQTNVEAAKIIVHNVN